MTKENKNVPAKSSKWSMAGAVGSAVAASICCIGPLLVLFLGIGGAWASGLTALERFRPLFIGLTVLSLGWAYYQLIYKPKKMACEPGSQCADPSVQKRNRILFWIIAVITIVILAFPYFNPMNTTQAAVSSPAQVQSQTVVLNVQGMTCSACASGVEYSLKAMKGVLDAKVTLEPPQAVITIDPRLVKPQQLVDATTKIGYPSTLKN